MQGGGHIYFKDIELCKFLRLTNEKVGNDLFR